MESTKRKKEWIPIVERSFEMSRLESQFMAVAYEQLLPLVQHRVASQRPSRTLTETTNAEPRWAAGA